MIDAGRAERPPAGAGRLQIWLVDLAARAAELEAAALADLTEYLSDDEQRRASAMADDLRRTQWIAARVSLRCAIEEFSTISLARRPFDIAAGGKPFLPAPFPHFSLSHCAGLALIALTDAQLGPLGVDLEAIRPNKMSPDRAAQIECLAELLADGASLPTETSTDATSDPAACRFIQAWCRVEAFAKADGRGVARLLADAGILGAGSQRRRQQQVALKRPSPAMSPAAACWAQDLKLAALAPGYAGAVAYARQAAPLEARVHLAPQSLPRAAHAQ